MPLRVNRCRWCPSIRFVLRQAGIALVGVLVFLVASRPATAQDSTETSDDSPVAVVPLDGAEIQLGAIAQVDLNARADEQPSGFDVRAARLRTRIQSHGLEAFLQTEFARSPAVFDLRLRYRPHPQVRLTAGLFKSPFSRSHLDSRTRIPFAERPVAVDAIAPRRQIGAAIRLQNTSGTVSVETGIFNGNGREIQPNDNEHFLYVARLTGAQETPAGTVTVGVNSAYSIDDGVRLRDLSEAPFSGKRAVFGADAEIRDDLWLLSVEALVAHLRPDATAADPSRDAAHTGVGGYVTGGVPLPWVGDNQTLQAVARYEQFNPNQDEEDGRDLARISAGLNFRPAETIRIQWTGVVPLRERPGDLDGPFMTLRLELALQ